MMSKLTLTFSRTNLKLLQPSSFKVNLIRNFQSVTTGETFNYPREQSPFLKKPEELCSLPYYVRRTKFLSLPIYSEFKNGRTRKLTILRRIQGDVFALKQDLLTKFPEWDVVVSPINNSIVIKGLKVHELRDFLFEKGF